MASTSSAGWSHRPGMDVLQGSAAALADGLAPPSHVEALRSEAASRGLQAIDQLSSPEASGTGHSHSSHEAGHGHSGARPPIPTSAGRGSIGTRGSATSGTPGGRGMGRGPGSIASLASLDDMTASSAALGPYLASGMQSGRGTKAGSVDDLDETIDAEEEVARRFRAMRALTRLDRDEVDEGGAGTTPAVDEAELTPSRRAGVAPSLVAAATGWVSEKYGSSEDMDEGLMVTDGPPARPSKGQGQGQGQGQGHGPQLSSSGGHSSGQESTGPYGSGNITVSRNTGPSQAGGVVVDSAGANRDALQDADIDDLLAAAGVPLRSVMTPSSGMLSNLTTPTGGGGSHLYGTGPQHGTLSPAAHRTAAGGGRPGHHAGSVGTGSGGLYSDSLALSMSRGDSTASPATGATVPGGAGRSPHGLSDGSAGTHEGPPSTGHGHDSSGSAALGSHLSRGTSGMAAPRQFIFTRLPSRALAVSVAFPGGPAGLSVRPEHLSDHHAVGLLDSAREEDEGEDDDEAEGDEEDEDESPEGEGKAGSSSGGGTQEQYVPADRGGPTPGARSLPGSASTGAATDEEQLTDHAGDGRVDAASLRGGSTGTGRAAPIPVGAYAALSAQGLTAQGSQRPLVSDSGGAGGDNMPAVIEIVSQRAHFGSEEHGDVIADRTAPGGLHAGTEYQVSRTSQLSARGQGGGGAGGAQSSRGPTDRLAGHAALISRDTEGGGSGLYEDDEDYEGLGGMIADHAATAAAATGSGGGAGGRRPKPAVVSPLLISTTPAHGGRAGGSGPTGSLESLRLDGTAGVTTGASKTAESLTAGGSVQTYRSSQHGPIAPGGAIGTARESTGSPGQVGTDTARSDLSGQSLVTIGRVGGAGAATGDPTQATGTGHVITGRPGRGSGARSSGDSFDTSAIEGAGQQQQQQQPPLSPGLGPGTGLPGSMASLPPSAIKPPTGHTFSASHALGSAAAGLGPNLALGPVIPGPGPGQAHHGPNVPMRSQQTVALDRLMSEMRYSEAEVAREVEKEREEAYARVGLSSRKDNDSGRRGSIGPLTGINGRPRLAVNVLATRPAGPGAKISPPADPAQSPAQSPIQSQPDLTPVPEPFTESLYYTYQAAVMTRLLTAADKAVEDMAARRASLAAESRMAGTAVPYGADLANHDTAVARTITGLSSPSGTSQVYSTAASVASEDKALMECLFKALALPSPGAVDGYSTSHGHSHGLRGITSSPGAGGLPAGHVPAGWDVLVTSDGWGMFDPAMEHHKRKLAELAAGGSGRNSVAAMSHGQVLQDQLVADGAHGNGTGVGGGAGAGGASGRRDSMTGAGGKVSADELRKQKKSAGYNPQQVAFLDNARMSRALTRAGTATGLGSMGSGHRSSTGPGSGGSYLNLGRNSQTEGGGSVHFPGSRLGVYGPSVNEEPLREADEEDSAGHRDGEHGGPRSRGRTGRGPDFNSTGQTQDPRVLSSVAAGAHSARASQGGTSLATSRTDGEGPNSARGGGAKGSARSSGGTNGGGAANSPDNGRGTSPTRPVVDTVGSPPFGPISARSTASVWAHLTAVFSSPKTARVAPMPTSRTASPDQPGTARSQGSNVTPIGQYTGTTAGGVGRPAATDGGTVPVVGGPDSGGKAQRPWWLCCGGAPVS